jgi:Fe-S cluster assembly protein SufD
MKEIFVAQFERNQAGGVAPEWLRSLQRSAFERFDLLGYPTTGEEGWKYTSVEPIAKIPFELGLPDERGGRLENELVERSAFYGADDLRFVFLNGHYQPRLSSQSLPKGIVVGNLSDLLRQDGRQIETFMAREADFKNRPFVALNTAFLRDGAYLLIPKGMVVDRPIYLCHYSWASMRPTVSHPRNLIVAEEGSQATIVEIYMGGGEQTYFTNAVTEIVVGPNAAVDHYRLQQESGKAYHIGSVDARQERDSRFSSFAISLGSSLGRNETGTLLDAEGAACELNGFFMVTGRQQIDNQTSIDHAKPHGTSNELYKGILDGSAKGVFNGRIVVRPNAQKTNARQTNKNLVLSDEALMNTKPLLEIFNNDVKCNHGATIGRLDENQVFYLRSRGIPAHQARSLLTYAFASDLIHRIRVPSLKTALEKLIFRRLMASEMDTEAL